MNEIKSGNLFAIPHNRNVGPPERITELLDHMEKHPLWFTSSLSSEDVRMNCIWILADDTMWKWEVWLGGRMVGMILLSDVVPKVSATLHFTFYGTSLFSARALLWNMIGRIFEDFQLERLSFEVPENVKGLIGFMRKMGFRYEGEQLCSEHPLTLFLKGKESGRFHVADAATWIARQGSRREACHWDGSQWRDVVLLRLRRAEYEALLTPRDEPRAASEPIEDRYAAQVQASQI